MDIKEIKKILKKITFQNSCIDVIYKFQVKEIQEGFLYKASFKHPDTNTGNIGVGYGRWMFVGKNIDENGIIMTICVCVELIVKHEFFESFFYKECRVFDQHKSLEALVYPHILNSKK